MNTREKTAAISTALNILLTLFKFVMFAFTGSLAILAEAWHSFSDIATSFMVFLAVFDKNKKDKNGDTKNGEDGEAAKDAKGVAAGDETAKDGEAVPKSESMMESIVSFSIGLLLTVVSVILFLEFFTGDTPPLRNTLVAGIIFLAFALAEYLVYRFETSVGRQEKSVGLIADGMHSKADMVASLIAGFSLILYHLGIDVDRYAAGIIALFILSYALETLINSILSTARKDKGPVISQKARQIQASVLDRSSWVSLAEVLRSKTFGKLIRKALAGRLIRAAIGIVALAVLGFYASTCWFTVGYAEQAVVERFGRPINPGEPLGPGLHFTMPWPVDRPVVVETESVRQMNIGNEVDENAFALLWTREHGTEIPFLSGDNNFFYPYLVIHYRITNLYDYLYRHTDAEALLKAAAYRTVTRLFSTKAFYEIVLTYRRGFVRDVVAGIQQELDGLQAGIEIVTVSVKDVHPPIRVADSFEKVIAAFQEKEEMINKARGYASESLLESKGEAARLEEEAKAYVADLKLRAEGDATKFLARIPEGSKAMEVTRIRLYLEAMTKALARRDKTLIDPRAGTPEMWLNFDDAFGASRLEFDRNQF